MSSLTIHRPHVQIPRNSDGYLIPSLLPVAAYLCVEDYSDGARARVLERLADGVPARECAADGLIEWRDLAEVERLLAGRRPYCEPIAPVCGGSPEIDLDAVCREPSGAEPGCLTIAEWDAQCAAHDAEMAAARPEPYQPTEEDERWLLSQHGDESRDDFPRAMTPAAYRRVLRGLVAEFTGA